MRSDNPMIAQHEEGMTQEKKFSTIPARDKAGVILAWLTEHKARDVAAFELAGNPLTDAIIVASASSARHARSLADGLLELCDRILVLKEGEQFALGTPAEVFAHAEELRAIGLGVPAAQKLANDLRNAGFALPAALYDADTLADDLAALYQAHQEGSHA